MKHKLFIIISFCILLSVLAGCAETPLIELYGLTDKTHAAVTPVHKNGSEWWRVRHESILNRVKKGDVDLIFIGDSITHGWEGAGKELWSGYYAARNAVNMGYGGDRTEHVLWRLDNGEIDGISPKLAVLMIGTNNSNRDDYTAEEISDGIKAICLRLRLKLPKTKILMLSIFPRGAGPSPQREKNAKASELASQIADNKMVYYLDINDEFLHSEGVLSREIMPDLLHPNKKGYKIWAEAIEPMIVKLMGETRYTEAELADMYGLTGKSHSAVTPSQQRSGFPPGRWTPRHEKILKRVSQGNVDLIFIGDSITHQWDRYGQKVWDRYYAPRNAVNMGVVGDRTQQVLWRLNHGEIDGISPKLAVLMIGTNNCTARGDKYNTAEEIADGIKAICAKINPERRKNAKASELASQIADNDMIYYLDINDKFLDANGRLTTEFLSDGTHPNEKGYKIWAEAIEPTVARLMGEDGYSEAQLAALYGLAGKTHSAVMPVEQQAEFTANWWMPRHKKVLNRVSHGNVDLVFVGDSITHCWERSGKELWNKYYASRNALNLGFIGDRTQHVLWRLDNGEIDGISPELAVVMVGTNNCKDNTVEEIADGIKAVCAKIRYKLPKTKIILLSIFPRGASSNPWSNPERAKNARASKLASQIADNNMIYYLNINDRFLGADGSLSMDVMPDLLHPNEKGYNIWFNAIEPMVAKLMDEKVNFATYLSHSATEGYN